MDERCRCFRESASGSMRVIKIYLSLANLNSPFQAFESVVPSERTVLSLHTSNCSLQLRAPSHPGSIVGALNDVDFSADLVGNSPEMSMRLRIASAWILAIDAVLPSEPKLSSRTRTVQASDYWRVSI